MAQFKETLFGRHSSSLFASTYRLRGGWVAIRLLLGYQNLQLRLQTVILMGRFTFAN